MLVVSIQVPKAESTLLCGDSFKEGRQLYTAIFKEASKERYPANYQEAFVVSIQAPKNELAVSYCPASVT